MTPVPQIFDRPLIARRLSQPDGRSPDFITKLIVQDLQDRLATISRPFNKALILAPDISHLPQNLRAPENPITLASAATLLAPPERFQDKRNRLPDSETRQNKDLERGFDSIKSRKAPDALIIDPENLELPRDDYDLIISLFDVGITNDVPGFLSRILHHLTPDGLFMAAFIGGTSLHELRAAWLEADAEHLGGAMARVAPFIDTRDAGGLLQRAGFALPVADVETHIIRYANPLALMKEIKLFGASNPLAERGGKPVTPAHLASACAAYQNGARDKDDRIRATLEIIWIAGWAPDASQPKPLAPGSAKVSLTEVFAKYPLKNDQV